MNTVSHPIALRLKDEGWEGETEKVLIPLGELASKFNCYPKWYAVPRDYGIVMSPDDWLPAPNISEIRERLTDLEILDYILVKAGLPDYTTETFWNLEIIKDILTVTASADELAEVWIWKEGK